MTEFLPISTNTPITRVSANATALETAQKLEATFLAEMLKATGLGAQPNSMSGGVGEDQFASFHRQILAEAMVKRGGIGLAETFYNAMMEKQND